MHGPIRATTAGYAELHCCTNFSFLRGASHADELVARAAELGYQGLAITDQNTLAGVVRAHAAAKDHGLHLMIGAELVTTEGLRMIALCTNRAAYGRLARLLTLGRRRAAKGDCELTVDDIAAHAEGLIAAAIPESFPSSSPAPADLSTFREIFGEQAYLLAEFHYGVQDDRRAQALAARSRQTRLPLVAAGDVHYHIAERLLLQQVLTAIQHTTTVSELGDLAMPNAERHLRSMDQIQRVFRSMPAAVERTLEIASRCQFSLDELRYEYPTELAPTAETSMAYLRRLTWEGAHFRYEGDIPGKVCQQLEHELKLIEDLRYEAFFLTVFDMVQFARSRDILCQGRGSAANSAVCYCLGITAIDPMETDLLFERFVSRERDEAPDIDVDFEHERREEVLQYIYEKYGRDRAGLAATVITYRARSAIRDVGKALGLSLDRVDALAKNTDFHGEHATLPDRCRQVGLAPESRKGQQFIGLVNAIIGFPRHLSQHVGGMVITQGPLCELVPIENAAMEDRTVIQWDKDDLDELGILKVDCLALGMLSAIHKCFDLVHQHTGRQLTIANIPQDDDVYTMISRGDTVGVFQIESRAQMSMLPRLRPKEFYDLVIEVAIVRPGPIQGDMVHPYLRRRNGEEAVTYPNEEIRKVLHRTLGVPLFQEQAMQLAVVAAGFTPGEADQLRRAMAGWRRPGLIDEFRKKLIDGMLDRGYSEEFAERLFNQIRGFGEYGFPESHAASFAKLAYVSAWLKYHYQAAFTAAIINSLPMGFYAPAQLIRDAQQSPQGEVRVLPIDINHSDWHCTLASQPCLPSPPTRPPALPDHGGPTDAVANSVCESRESFNSAAETHQLRLGLCLVRGLGESTATQIMDARDRPFLNMEDFVDRTGLGRAAIEKLADVDAFGSLGIDRRAALWYALDQTSKPESLPLFADLTKQDEPAPSLPTLTSQEQVFADYNAAGLTLREHPLHFYRKHLQQTRVLKAEQLQDHPANRYVKVAGLVLMRQRPSTAKGITFITLEDETGIANLVVHQHIWNRYAAIARRSGALIVSGKLERQHEVIHVIAKRLEDLAEHMESLRLKSRDFR
ncbi:MAG: error-prone DNA polymerase [Planctomycetota bacterium]